MATARPPVRSWSRFYRDVARTWRAGEHVTIIGGTGSGKSELARRILPIRAHSVVLGSKPRDPTLEAFEADGWQRITKWPPDDDVRRALLWPPITARSDLDTLGPMFADALDDIFIEGAWAVYVDELHYATGRLGLAGHLSDLWEQGRSLAVTLIVATQRPANIPLLAYSQATYIALFRTTDARDLDRLADISGDIDRDVLRDTVRRLPRYAFAWVDTRAGKVVITRTPPPDKR